MTILRRLAVVGLSLLIFAAPQVARAGETEAAPTIDAAAWIVVDADTGAVVDSHNEREPLQPASTIKLLTALIAVQRIDGGEPVPISTFAESMPPRRIGAHAGEQWNRDALLGSMLISSANDAAVALAEHAGGGSLEGYLRLANETATRLGLEDEPFLPEPSGLNDESAFMGGSLISVRDLAIVARAVLAEERLMSLIPMPRYEFVGGDGLDHYVLRQNRLFGRYPDAIGLKTGATESSGRTMVAAARREGRTVMAVLFDAPDMYGVAETLLDRGFEGRAVAASDVLPPVVAEAAVAQPVRTGTAGASTEPLSLTRQAGFAIAGLAAVAGAAWLGRARRNQVRDLGEVG